MTPASSRTSICKQWIATSGLVVLPKTGHVVNQEEPALFNDAVSDFIARVEAGRWPARDPRSIRKASGRSACSLRLALALLLAKSGWSGGKVCAKRHGNSDRGPC